MFFLPKIGKIPEISDHNLDPWGPDEYVKKSSKAPFLVTGAS
jgi:hypothetical protein